MASALGRLRADRNAVFFLDGQTEMGRRVDTFGINAFWENASDAFRTPARVDTNVYEGVKLTERLVGDGEHFWSYSADRKTYSSTSYATQLELSQMLRAQARGHAAMLAAILSDAFGKTPTLGDSQWTPWLPISRAEVSGSSIVLSVGEPLRTQMVIDLVPPDPNEPMPSYRLVGVSFWESTWVGSKERITTWTLSVHSNVRGFEPGVFVFVPPRDARPISMPVKRQGG